ncbi:MAG TPA: hypothetical protein VN883_03825 [Myxococcales bacterium]|nr:hypothetical protein [Myxococcales bacterium]
MDLHGAIPHGDLQLARELLQRRGERVENSRRRGLPQPDLFRERLEVLDVLGVVESAIRRYRALTGEDVAARFDVPEFGITIARVGQFALISGAESGTELMTPVRVTFAVESVREFEAFLKSLGFAILQPPTRRTTGSNLLVRDADGGVFEFVETRTSGP